MFRLTGDEIRTFQLEFYTLKHGRGRAEQLAEYLGNAYSIAINKEQVKKIADKIEDMANDGDSVGDILKAMREEIKL